MRVRQLTRTDSLPLESKLFLSRLDAAIEDPGVEHLAATLRPIAVSNARNTTPMAPRPSSPSSRYGPMEFIYGTILRHLGEPFESCKIVRRSCYQGEAATDPLGRNLGANGGMHSPRSR